MLRGPGLLAGRHARRIGGRFGCWSRCGCPALGRRFAARRNAIFGGSRRGFRAKRVANAATAALRRGNAVADRKSVVSGKSVSVRVGLGGRRILKKKNNKKNK